MVERDAPADQQDRLQALLQAAREGSREAQGRLLELCRHYLLQVANAELDSQLKVKAGGSDLVQETYVEALRIFERFQGDSPVQLRAWLRAILLNKLGDFGRRFRDAAKRQLGKEVGLDGDGDGDKRPEPAASVLTPSRAAVHAELATAVTAALARLPEHYRHVIVLRQMDELSFEEMAERLGRSADAVRKLWWRAIQQLQAEMGTSL